MKKKKRITIFTRIQIVITVCLCVFIFHMVHSHYAKDVDLKTVSTTMLSECKGLKDLNEGTAGDIKRTFEINSADYDWVMYYCGGGAMDVSELFIVKTGNDDAMDAAVSGAENRLSTQITNFTNYGTNQIELLNNAVTLQIGDYYFYCVSENASQWKEVFLGLVR